jgi:hypothetical protein
MGAKLIRLDSRATSISARKIHVQLTASRCVMSDLPFTSAVTSQALAVTWGSPLFPPQSPLFHLTFSTTPNACELRHTPPHSAGVIWHVWRPHIGFLTAVAATPLSWILGHWERCNFPNAYDLLILFENLALWGVCKMGLSLNGLWGVTSVDEQTYVFNATQSCVR